MVVVVLVKNTTGLCQYYRFLLLVLLLCFTVVLVTNTTGCTNTPGLFEYYWLISILPFLLLCLFCCFGY